MNETDQQVKDTKRSGSSEEGTKLQGYRREGMPIGISFLLSIKKEKSSYNIGR
ncbi:hypothetical protein [Merdibacter massiliensis]|uniref:hypothetical protein n=1 Tax=Merdibacter massiliensis TaxID=1871030 RepID=UPI0012B62D2A|nr:hypothetical protein [Merdibacter massiliensis]